MQHVNDGVAIRVVAKTLQRTSAVNLAADRGECLGTIVVSIVVCPETILRPFALVSAAKKRICGRKSQSYTTATVSENCPKLPEVTFSKSDSPDFHNSLNKKPPEGFPGVSNWVQGLDLNQRPSGYEPWVMLFSRNVFRNFQRHLGRQLGPSRPAVLTAVARC